MSHFFVSKWKMCRLISILYLYQKQHLLWTIQKNPCTLNSKESFMNPSASYSSTELPKKKIVSRYYNMLPFVLFWSISVSQNPDHEPISNPAFSTTDHGPEFVHTICSNTGKMQTSRKIKLVGEKNCSPGLEGDPCLANNIYIYTLKSHILFTRLTLK